MLSEMSGKEQHCFENIVDPANGSVHIDGRWLGLDPHKSVWCRYKPNGNNRAKSGSALSRVGRQEGHPTNGNKENFHITRCYFDNWVPSSTTSVL